MTRSTRNRTARARRHALRPFLDALEERALLATIQVTSTCDRPFEPDSILTLRDAILLVDGDLTVGQLSTAQQALVSGSPDQPGVTDTIDFASGVSGTITLTSGELAITDPVDIQGPGAGGVTVSGNNASCVFDVSADATISGLTITGGSSSTGGGLFNEGGTLTVNNSTFTSNTGSGLFNEGGTLTVNNSTFSQNLPAHDLATDQTPCAGGGIDNEGGTLAVNNSTFDSNTGGIYSEVGTFGSSSAYVGGGIYNSQDGLQGGIVTVNGSTFTGNIGGGILNYRSSSNGAYRPLSSGETVPTMTVIDSTFTNNQAASGTGVLNFGGGTLTVDSSTISGNSAIQSPDLGTAGSGGAGGGLDTFLGGSMTVTNSTISDNVAGYDPQTSQASGYGGGLSVSDGAVATLINCTIAGNSADLYGGGIFQFEATLTLTNCTISSNSATIGGGGIWAGGLGLSVGNTIIAGNTAPAGPDVSATVTSDGYNLIGNTSGSSGFSATGDQLNVNPLLEPLVGNGGPTQTMALLPGSPAIDAGSSSIAGVNAPITDQRGALRGGQIGSFNAGSAVDIGAYEASSSYLVTSTAASTDVGTLQSAIGWASVNTNANPANIANPAPNTIVFAPPDTQTLDSDLTAIGSLVVNASSPVPILIDLSATTYQNTDSNGDTLPINVTAPANTTLTLNGPPSGTATLYDLVSSGTVTVQGNITMIGNSPALVVNSGQATIADGITLVTTTDAPTILVNGGTLIVRDSTVEQNSATSSQPAIQISGGSVDLGTSTDLGGNTIDDDGTSQLIENTTGNPVPIAGDWLFTANGVSVPVDLTVTNTTDFGPGSLQEAILEANTNPGAAGSIIAFDPTVFATPQTITVPNTLVPSESAGPEVLEGPGANLLTINGSGAVGVFEVDSGTTASLSGLTITGGSATDGGGIDNAGNLTVSGTTITGTIAYHDGGGIDNSGTLTVADSTMTGNGALNGGGIDNTGNLTVSGTTIADNYGGDIDNSGTLTVAGSTIAGNGGGIDNTGTLTLTNSTIVGNAAGGGIDNAGTLTAVNATIAFNAAGLDDEPGAATTLYNTIVAFNIHDIAGGQVSPASTNNLIGIGGAGGLTNANGNLVGVANPGLAAGLANNGGPTQTIALLPGSPAIDHGSTTVANAYSLTTDQRGAGFLRIVNGTVDIGAFESPTFGNPTVYMVNLTSDTAAGSGTTGDLLYCITQANANTNTAGSEIEFDPTVFNSSSPQTIDLTSTLVLSESPWPEVIQGPGANVLTVNGNNAVTVFQVDGSTTASISGLTISGGNAGGIENSGTLTVTDCTVTGNRGGGIDSHGILTVSDSTITDNSAEHYGGGIDNQSGLLTVTDSTLSDNSAYGGPAYGIATAGAGGGIALRGGAALITGSTIEGNSAGVGGGIFLWGASLTITNSAIAENSATASGSSFTTIGGSYMVGGGGILELGRSGGGSAKVTDCTIADNSTQFFGGGILVNSGALTITSSTIAGNQIEKGSDIFVGPAEGGGLYDSTYVPGGGALLDNTIVADNTDLNGPDDIAGNAVSPASAYNLVGVDLTGSLTNGMNGNQVGVTNPGLGTLADNGGPTETMALLPGSPALGAGNVALAVDANGNPLTTDQRGEPRVVNGAVDIGAFEAQQEPTTTTVIASPATSVSGQSVTFIATVTPQTGGAIPVGSIQFEIDGSDFGGPVPLVDGSATSAAISSLSIGGHTVSAVYTSDSPVDFRGSTGSTSITVEAATVSNIQSVVNDSPASSGGLVTIQTASSAAVSTTVQAINAATPSSPVTVTLDLAGARTTPTTAISAPSTVEVDLTSSSGSATVSDATVMSGTVVVTASVAAVDWTVDGGNVVVEGSASAGDFVVNGGTVTLADGTVITGNSPAITVNAGTVILQDARAQTATDSPTIVVNGGSLLVRDSTIEGSTGYAQPAILINGGSVDLGTDSNPGDNVISANDGGQLVSNATSSSVPDIGNTLEVNGTPLSSPYLSFTALASSTASSVRGQSVTFNASVSVANPTDGTPTGTVDFIDTTTGVNLGTAMVTNGVAALTTSSLPVGINTITADYEGDNNFAFSASTFAQTVSKASTSTTVALSPNSSVSGQSVTFTATVSVVSPGSTAVAYPTGTVTFYATGTSIGTGMLSVVSGQDVATFTTSSLSTATQSITATYTSGDTNFNASPTSAAISQVVNKDSTTTAAGASPGFANVGQTVTFTATVTANAPGSGTPTGTVNFYDTTTSTDLTPGGVALSAGAATFATTSLAAGSHTIKATYSGDTNFLTSFGNTGTVTIGQTIFVLDPSAGGALSLSGNASIKIGGGVYVDSSSSSALSASGNASVKASVIDVHGGVQKSGNATFSPTPTTGAATVADPLASLAEPSTSGLTNHGSESLSGNSSATIQPGIYSSISVSGNASLALNGGTYIIEGGGLSVSGNANISGSGVLIVNAGSDYPSSGGTYGSITLSGNGSYKLTPASTGTYAGIVIFQTRDNSKALTVSGNASGMTGTIYAPAAQLSESGNASLNAALIVDTLTISGNGVANTLTLDAPSGTVAYMPAQIRDAYGINALTQDGTGQTIAIVDAYDDPSIDQALDAFDAQFGLTASGPSLYAQYGPASSFLTVLNQYGQATSLPSTDPNGPGTDNWEVEEALDVEWAHAIAPGAQIILVEANSQSLSDLMASVATAAAQPGVSVVSMSWGFSEGQAVFAADEANDDSVFNVPGVTFVASTGDYGAADPEYPAFSPNVVAVGGTSLTLNADNSYNSETGWGYYSDSAGTLIGSGGGISLYEAEPAYQQRVQTTGGRSTPDVALVADPATGAWIADPYNLDPSNPFEVVGGTSLSAPAWAGLAALVNQGRAAAGEPNLNSSSPTETQQALYMLPQSDYNVISSGNNGYSANSGYNLVTGLGTPVANVLVPDLVSYQGPGTSYAGPGVGPLHDASLVNVGTDGGGPIDVFSAFDAIAVMGNGRLAAGVADWAPTALDLNIPDPPEGADPPMAAGFRPGPTVGLPVSGAAVGSATTAVPAAAMPLPSASGRWSVISGQWPAAGGPTSPPVGPEPTLVVQGLDHESGLDLSFTGPDAARVIDSVLADLVTDADRSRDEEASETSSVRVLPGAGDMKDGIGPEQISPDRSDPTGFVRRVEVPPHVRRVKRGLIRMDAISDLVLDERATSAVELPGRPAGPGDPIARPETPQEPGNGLAKLAATLIVAGSWGHRARFGSVTRRPAGRPRYRKESE